MRYCGFLVILKVLGIGLLFLGCMKKEEGDKLVKDMERMGMRIEDLESKLSDLGLEVKGLKREKRSGGWLRRKGSGRKLEYKGEGKSKVKRKGKRKEGRKEGKRKGRREGGKDKSMVIDKGMKGGVEEVKGVSSSIKKYGYQIHIGAFKYKKNALYRKEKIEELGIRSDVTKKYFGLKVTNKDNREYPDYFFVSQDGGRVFSYLYKVVSQKVYTLERAIELTNYIISQGYEAYIIKIRKG